MMTMFINSAQNNYDFNNDDNGDDGDANNDLILRTARVSTSATFDICHGDVDGVHVTL